jgi:hypothetical protein
VPLSNFVPRLFGIVHHLIAILYHQVPNPSLTIRNFFIAAGKRERLRRAGLWAVDDAEYYTPPKLLVIQGDLLEGVCELSFGGNNNASA